jgi:hypothetical protein
MEHCEGIPRLINRLCKLSLKAGETQKLAHIDADVVEAVAKRFEPVYEKDDEEREEERRQVLQSKQALDQSIGTLPGETAAETSGEGRTIRQPEYRMPADGTANQVAPTGPGLSTPGSKPRRPALTIPKEVLQALKSLADEKQRVRLAGQLAAKQIQEHPERYQQAASDPVKAWDELRSQILTAVS